MTFDSVWAVGAGNMAGAMLHRWLATGMDPARLTVIRKSGAAFADGVATFSAVPPGAAAADMVMLGVKPQMLDLVAGPLAAAMRPGTVLVSILAGVEIAALRARFPTARIVRAMPNLPVAIGRGVVALYAAEPEPDAVLRAAMDRLMAPLGLVEWLDDEAAMDVAAAVAGSGPAFLYRFVDALAAAGVAAGFGQDQAARLALATVAGAAEQARGGEASPAAMAERVASPGGSTRKGLDVLDADGALVSLMTRMIAAAVARNREMAAAARG
ncbi:pyrroline-5-carboxylate reductase family protein [Sphingomonas montana]|uniref:pyrroline-5-carboxylate reductase family protein n=1 Tax=Sphingomonas montana TaxID=1843236 RepID=UPI00096EC07C|nr:pyrroline-5-carboxylate reductase dimerization domain-containing protein [Sphingomonas montana]